MKVVIFIQTNKSGSSRDAIKACDRMNYYTILLTNKKKQVRQRDEYNDVHKMIYVEDFTLKNLEFIVRNDIRPQFDIVSILSFVDGYVSTASKLRDIFINNPSNTASIEIMENKILSRKLFDHCDFNPSFLKIKVNDKNKKLFKYPLIIKKAFSSSSRDVKKIDRYQDIPRHYLNASDVLIEEFVEGNQYLYEVFVLEGKPHVIAKFKQNIYSKNNSFIIHGYSLKKNFKLSKEEKEMLKTITEELDVVNGEFHLEVRYSNNVYKLIEVNPRPTGTGMNDILKIATGVDYIEQLVRFYLGEEFEIPIVRNDVYTKFLLSNKEGKVTSVTGRKTANMIPGVSKVFIKRRKENYIRKPRHMGDRNGYVIATGENIKKARENAIKASKKIRFNIEGED